MDSAADGREMSEPISTERTDAFADAVRRIDQAVTHLELSARTARGRLTALDGAEAEARRLAGERTRLAVELDRANANARRLDDKAAEVSRRLVEAMEGVKTVLSGSAG